MWKYCKYTGLFIDMAKYLLTYNDSEVYKKLDIDFKPGYLYDMIKLDKKPINDFTDILK